MSEQTQEEILQNAPDNWGRWGDDDEIGTINLLTEDQVLKGIKTVQEGKVFTLGAPIMGEQAGPVFPGGRATPQHYMRKDHSHHAAGKVSNALSDRESADDLIHMPLHGTTHFDSLGHSWYGGQIYNGFDEETTMGGLEFASIKPIAEHGVVGKATLLDVARYRDVDYLETGSRITLEELQACAEAQDTTVEDRDILLVRTGWIEKYYAEGAEKFFEGEYNEPGITYTDEMIQWFHDKDITTYATDTMGNEQTTSDTTGTRVPLHPGLLRDLGMPLNETCYLEELGEDCADDGRYEFLFVGAPLKVDGGTGSPVNPIVIK
jgi:kynurenine formamidase